MINHNLIEPVRKYLSDLLGVKIPFNDIHNEIILIDMNMPPINEILSTYIKNYLKEISDYKINKN
jgi:hypothetical protein